MQVGTLVKIRSSNIGDVGRFAIVVKYLGGKNATLHVIGTGEVWTYGLSCLEVVCE